MVSLNGCLFCWLTISVCEFNKLSDFVLARAKSLSKVCNMIWLASWASKMNQTCIVIGFPNGQYAIFFGRSGLPLCPAEDILNPSLTKLARAAWLEIKVIINFQCYFSAIGAIFSIVRLWPSLILYAEWLIINGCRISNFWRLRDMGTD